MKNIVYEVNQFYQTLGTVCPKYKGIKVDVNDLMNDNILSEILYNIEDNICVEGAEELRNFIKHQRHKQNIRYKIIQTIGTILITLGFVFILGTAGASDNDAISFAQIIIQIVISFGISMLGLIIKKITY
jgi:hypothetical protein